ncbi:CAP domain-containing protein [Streptomyces kaniharaensis]|uniref:CAP domain-containing protein n=1 Tax=Streptomyces kaniharaensis TaxID=212423 RepID=A0A6N7KX83_9ACTN|nr:CAP domain-containing protein [Streptomyces kaniharaensis]MQS16140.1 CAP domain-containing protein [Streptomyces kaniharaensis]
MDSYHGAYPDAETVVIPPAGDWEPTARSTESTEHRPRDGARTTHRADGGRRRAVARRGLPGAPLTLAVVGTAATVAALVAGVTASLVGDPGRIPDRAGSIVTQAAPPDATAAAPTPTPTTSPSTAGSATAQPTQTAAASPTPVAPTTMPASERTTTAPHSTPPLAGHPTAAAPPVNPPAAGRSTSAPNTNPPAAGRPAAAAPPVGPPVGGGTAQQFAQQVLDLTNEQRAQNGCGPLTGNVKLQAAAQGHSNDMAARDFFDHTNPDGDNPGQRIDATGYQGRGLGENIARGQADPATVVDGWMRSPEHRANILNCAFTELGVGVHLGPGGPWWTQDFGTPR